MLGKGFHALINAGLFSSPTNVIHHRLDKGIKHTSIPLSLIDALGSSVERGKKHTLVPLSLIDAVGSHGGEGYKAFLIKV